MMLPENVQSPAALLEYEPAEHVAKLRRRRRRRHAAFTLALLFAVLVGAAGYRLIRSDVARWQRDRALSRAMAKPAGERFPDAEVTYTVPPGFHSRTSRRFPAIPADYGPSSAS